MDPSGLVAPCPANLLEALAAVPSGQQHAQRHSTERILRVHLAQFPGPFVQRPGLCPMRMDIAAFRTGRSGPMDRTTLATPNHRRLAGTLLLLPRQGPFALVLREPITIRVAGVI